MACWYGGAPSRACEAATSPHRRGSASYAGHVTTAIERFLVRHVEQGTIPGAVASLGRELTPVAVGSTEVGGPPLRTDAIFRIQSMTKPIAAVAALRLVERGGLALDEPVDRWMPELADRRVLRHPAAAVDDTVAADRPITLRHLLTNQSGYGVIVAESPLQAALVDAGLAPSNDPADRGAEEWLTALAALPLAHQPGAGWRYHLSFGLLGILLGRVAGIPTAEVLRREVFDVAGMPDTGFRVPDAEAHRLVPALRRGPDGFERVEEAGSGFHTGPAPFDESHSELVSTLSDYHAFASALVGGRLLAPELLLELRTDQIAPSAKTPESFFPGFWEGTGWGFGVSVVTDGPHAGRFGWSGGFGTDFFVDPDGTIGIVLTQVEMDAQILTLLAELQDVG